MSSKAAGQKTLRLMNLEQWARGKYAPEEWDKLEFRVALEEYCLITWGVSEGASKNMAQIVQLRLTRRMPRSIVSTVDDSEKDMSILEIIQGHRIAHPEEYKPPPATDFQVIEENDS